MKQHFEYLAIALGAFAIASLMSIVAHGALPVFWSSATGFQSRGVTFAQLSSTYSATNQTGVPQSNGTSGYCSDCGVGANNVCVGSGTGSAFEMVNGVFICGLLNAGVVGSVPDPLSLNTLTSIGSTPHIGNGYSVNGYINPVSYGAVAAQSYTTGVMNASSTFTDATAAPFKAGQVGQTIVVYGGLQGPDWAASTGYVRHNIIQPLTNNAGKFIYLNTVAGTSALAAPTFSQASYGQTVENSATATAEAVATGDGTTYIFRGTTAHCAIVPNSVSLLVNAVQVGTDNGAGRITGATINVGKISYGSCVYYVQFNAGSAPPNAQAVTITYNYGPAWLKLPDTGLPLVTTIKTFNSASSIVLNTATTTAAGTGVNYIFGPLNDTPFANAAAAAGTAVLASSPGNAGAVILPANSLFLTSTQWDLTNEGIEVAGNGWGPLFSANPGGATGSGILCTGCSGSQVIRIRGAFRTYLHDFRIAGVQQQTPITNGILNDGNTGGQLPQLTKIENILIGGSTNAYSTEPNSRQFVNDASWAGSTGNGNNNWLVNNYLDSSYYDYALTITNVQAGESNIMTSVLKGSQRPAIVADQLGCVYDGGFAWRFDADEFSACVGNGMITLGPNVSQAVINSPEVEQNSRIATFASNNADSMLSIQHMIWQSSDVGQASDNRLIYSTVGITANHTWVDFDGLTYTQLVSSPPTGFFTFDLSQTSLSEIEINHFVDATGQNELNANSFTTGSSFVMVRICSAQQGVMQGRLYCGQQQVSSSNPYVPAYFATVGQVQALGGGIMQQLVPGTGSTCNTLSVADASCTGIGVPQACCLGAGAGNCGNANCTANLVPFTCCTGSGTGTCGPAGAATCKYKFTTCPDPACTYGETTATGTVSTCTLATSPGTSDVPETFAIGGAAAYRIYGDDCAGGAFTKIATVADKDMVPVAGGLLGFIDTGVRSGAVPTSNTTGQFDPQGPFTAYLFANLGTPANGTVHYCSDCTIANPCAALGTGAIAKRLNGVWVCN